ncbi:hypothetical protein DFH07DRAFT_776880 [Mycena maculata]|uniref:Uncharacterized protein n=1 Tax=Mycena maculata TaxID=230809 RepID=A0AAD7IKL2_9AGAR|nr:hypothetical protein DFH07DRAFT_776880 [Mycena maculata]
MSSPCQHPPCSGTPSAARHTAVVAEPSASLRKCSPKFARCAEGGWYVQWGRAADPHDGAARCTEPERGARGADAAEGMSTAARCTQGVNEVKGATVRMQRQGTGGEAWGTRRKGMSMAARWCRRSEKVWMQRKWTGAVTRSAKAGAVGAAGRRSVAARSTAAGTDPAASGGGMGGAGSEEQQRGSEEHRRKDGRGGKRGWEGSEERRSGGGGGSEERNVGPLPDLPVWEARPSKAISKPPYRIETLCYSRDPLSVMACHSAPVKHLSLRPSSSRHTISVVDVLFDMEGQNFEFVHV